MKRKPLTLAVAVAAIALSGAATAQNVGPSTSTEPYVLPTRADVATTSILTTGDAVGGYRMVGIPDGAGAWNENHNTFNFVVNHELGKTVGVPRAHGSMGAFVSRWQIERGTLKVLNGRDHLSGPNDVFTWSNAGYLPGTTAFERLCSADLPRQSAFSHGAIGSSQRIFLSGEETSPAFSADHGRVFAHVLTGPDKNRTWELPRLGKMAFENAVASPYRQDKTIVMLNDDAGRETKVSVASVCRAAGQTGCVEPPSELYVYIGTKQRHGNDIENAGLTNGNLFGVRVVANGSVVTGENPDFVFGTAAPVASARFDLHNFGDVSAMTGVQLQDSAITNQVTQFIRIEDGAWDPRPSRNNDYYFVTTGRISTTSTWRPSRLWRLRFDDIKHPEQGGAIEMLLSSTFNADNVNDPGYQMFDNLTIDRRGRIVLQEDVGGNNRLGRIYVYGIDSGKLELVAKHNPKFFQPGEPGFTTNDEESSGIFDAARILGRGWFLMTTQNHTRSVDPELVEGGQFVALYIDPRIARAPGLDHDGDADDEDGED